ncbi:hypothetical protein Ae263Ps1_4280 [Pseudonocardia sp. Ae263_Ps1]|nr:hypothetical protein Ae150APs1_1053c [Pseudonocardia sp. Ae150A_Ps1]OLL87225.1 hypothetical protein Ae263Ps1_4280 [Pseudonocardia sp. Ae263_Ps1]OLL92745.1 hypothetical protein Ae356Ps1_2642c [Pseudonocardia sp. Ae356_Ps1]
MKINGNGAQQLRPIGVPISVSARPVPSFCERIGRRRTTQTRSA